VKVEVVGVTAGTLALVGVVVGVFVGLEGGSAEGGIDWEILGLEDTCWLQS